MRQESAPTPLMFVTRPGAQTSHSEKPEPAYRPVGQLVQTSVCCVSPLYLPGEQETQASQLSLLFQPRCGLPVSPNAPTFPAGQNWHVVGGSGGGGGGAQLLQSVPTPSQMMQIYANVNIPFIIL